MADALKDFKTFFSGYDHAEYPVRYQSFMAGYQAARRAGLEEAAKVCEELSADDIEGDPCFTASACEAGQKIRALAAEAAQGDSNDRRI